MSKKDILIIILLNIVWGTSFTAAGYAFKFYSPFFLYAIRFLSTGLMTIPFGKIPKKYMLNIFAISLLQTLTFCGIALGIKYLNSSTTAILNKLDVIFTITLASIVFKEKITPRLIIGIFLCFGAVYILSGGILINNFKYMFLMMFAAFSTACSNILVKKIKDVENRVIVSWSSVFIGFELLGLSLLFKEKFILQTLNIQSILVVLYLGLFSTYLAYIVIYHLLRKYETTKVMPFNFLNPIVSIFSGFLILGEEITLRKFVGIAMIIVGILLAEYKTKTIEK